MIFLDFLLINSLGNDQRVEFEKIEIQILQKIKNFTFFKGQKSHFSEDQNYLIVKIRHRDNFLISNFHLKLFQFSEKYEFKIFFFSEDQNYFKPLKEF
jgi:hypothetical protein